MVGLKSRVALIVILVLLGLAVFRGPFNPAYGSSTGLICIADPTSAVSRPDPCPVAPGAIFNGPSTSPGQQVRIGVFVYGSEALNGFDITLLTGHAVLTPAGVDLTGTVLLAPRTMVAECLGGVIIRGNACPGTAGTLDTLELVVVGAPGQLTVPPTTGLLFTAIYNITGTTGSTISVGFQSGCSGTSVGPDVCVTIVNGSLNPSPETVQSARFNNSNPPPFLTISSNSSMVGPMSVGSVGHLRLNLTGQNGWSSEPCPCAAHLSSPASNDLTVVLNATSVNLPSVGSVFVAMNVSSSIGGNVSATVLVQYSTVDPQNFNTSTLVAHVTVTAVVAGFSFFASPLVVPPVLVGASASSLVTVTSLNGFVGTVSFTTNEFLFQCRLTLASVVVSTVASSSLNCTRLSAGNFTVTVTAMDGLESHVASVVFVVQDFAISLTPALVSTVVGSNESIALSVLGLNGFDQPVTLSIAPSEGLVISPMTATLQAPGIVTLSFSGVSVGMYNVTVTVSSSTIFHSALVQVRVSPAPGGGSAPILGLAPVVFYSLLAGLAVLVCSLVVLWFRRRQASSVSQ